MDGLESAAAGQTADTIETPQTAAVRVTGLASLTILCLALVVVADAFFYAQPFGWTLGGYGLLLVVATFLRQWTLPRSVPTLLTAVATILLFASCLEEPSPLAITLGTLGLCSIGLMLRDGWTANALTWLARWGYFALAGWTAIFRDLATIRLTGNAADPGSRRSLLRNWSLAVVLTVVFVALFASANPIISDGLTTAWQKLTGTFDQFPTAGRILMWVLVMIGAWTLLQFRTGKNIPSDPPAAAPAQDPFFAMTVVAKYLLLFNVIFAVQTGLDVYYLWVGAALPKGLTYAAYAHRGAYPLLAAAILAGAFVMITFRSNSPGGAAAWARRLVYLWLAQNIFLVASAGWRLSLYVEVYTLTRWRVAAMIWMLLVACGLVWTIVRIGTGRSNLWLINVSVVTALVVLFACSFADFDRWIAEFNVRNCREVTGQGPPLDLNYLHGLGYDTLPALVWLFDHVPDPVLASRVRNTILQLQKDLHKDLHPWQGWTWRRQRLSRMAPVPEDSPAIDPSVLNLSESKPRGGK